MPVAKVPSSKERLGEMKTALEEGMKELEEGRAKVAAGVEALEAKMVFPAVIPGASREQLLASDISMIRACKPQLYSAISVLSDTSMNHEYRESKSV